MEDRWTAWQNYGATQENFDRFMDPKTSTSSKEFAPPIAQAGAPLFTKALFVDGYQANPRLKAITDREPQINASSLERALVTWKDSVPYKRTMTATEVKNVSGSAAEGQAGFTVNWTNRSNASENRIGTEYDAKDTIPVTGTYHFTMKVVDGKWKIADITY